MKIMQSPPAAYTVIDGRRYLYFVGTGYLGLQGHPEIIQAACEAMQQYGISSATSRRGFGNVPPTLDAERRAAEFFAADDAFYFASGYVGNHILAVHLATTGDVVFVDQWSHYSVLEGARLTGHRVVPFAHRDPEALAAALQQHLQPSQRPLVFTDGVFTARGTIAPLADYVDVLRGYRGAVLCVDDAHGLGVLGAHGRGTLEHTGLFDAEVNARPVEDSPHDEAPRLFFCGTLSKAIGGYGGIIPGRRGFIEQLKAGSPFYRGASAPPVPAAAATARALEIARVEPQRRTRLQQNVAALKDGLRCMGLELDDSPVPIICLSLGNAAQMQRIQTEMMDRGIVIAYMAAYSGVGPEGALRLAVFATHTAEMIAQLLDTLRELV